MPINLLRVRAPPLAPEREQRTPRNPAGCASRAHTSSPQPIGEPGEMLDLLNGIACHGEAILLADLAEDFHWPDKARS